MNSRRTIGPNYNCNVGELFPEVELVSEWTRLPECAWSDGLITALNKKTQVFQKTSIQVYMWQCLFGSIGFD